MALPCVLATALVLASSGHAALTISASSAKAEYWEQAVEVECTSVVLEYMAGQKLKKRAAITAQNIKIRMMTRINIKSIQCQVQRPKNSEVGSQA